MILVNQECGWMVGGIIGCFSSDNHISQHDENGVFPVDQALGSDFFPVLNLHQHRLINCCEEMDELSQRMIIKWLLERQHDSTISTQKTLWTILNPSEFHRGLSGFWVEKVWEMKWHVPSWHGFVFWKEPMHSSLWDVGDIGLNKSLKNNCQPPKKSHWLFSTDSSYSFPWLSFPSHTFTISFKQVIVLESSQSFINDVSTLTNPQNKTIAQLFSGKTHIIITPLSFWEVNLLNTQ